ncbi:hypothetical protein AAVH_01177 [Aphelenchoides avenae]|nr:hypothetical protein AAVH_01177 [Aphelenchus avenae]
MYNKAGLEKRRRPKERKKNSVNVIDRTTLPGHLGDIEDLNKLLEFVEFVHPLMVDALTMKPKTTGKKKIARRKCQDVPTVCSSEYAQCFDVSCATLAFT